MLSVVNILIYSVLHVVITWHELYVVNILIYSVLHVVITWHELYYCTCTYVLVLVITCGDTVSSGHLKMKKVTVWRNCVNILTSV